MSYQTIEYRGHEIEIWYSDFHESPDDWENTDIFLVFDHRDFCVERDGFDPQEIFEEAYSKGERMFKGYWIFPVTAYIHSGVALYLTDQKVDRWDSSFKGFVLVSHEEFGKPLESVAEKAAEGLIDTWNNYLRGEVYGWSTDWDSCGGYYGDESIPDMIEEAKGSIDYALKQETEKHIARRKRQIKARVPLVYR